MDILTLDSYQILAIGLATAIDRARRIKHYSLCDYVTSNIGLTNNFDSQQDAMSWLGQTFRCWHHYSGCPTFPVPCPNGHYSGAAYIAAKSAQNFYVGDYGVLRLDLARFLFYRLTGVELNGRDYTYEELEKIWVTAYQKLSKAATDLNSDPGELKCPE